MQKLIITFSLLCLNASAVPLSGEGNISVPGGRVWYHIENDTNTANDSNTRIPLLLIHGGPGGSSCSLAPLKKMANQRPIIFYDQLGAGKSEQPEDLSLWQINRFVDELDVVRKKLGFKQVHLLAHSWGAAIAAQYLQEKGSEGIASVIFVGPYLSTADWTQGTNELRKQLAPETQAILRKHELAGTTESDEYQTASEEFYRLFLFRHPHKELEECNDSAWNQTIYETMWGTSEFFTSGNLKNFNAAKDLQKIHIPTLFMVGEFDEARESTVRRYQQRMQNAQVTVINDAAHMSMIDNPDAFITSVTAFLAQVESQKTSKQ